MARSLHECGKERNEWKNPHSRAAGSGYLLVEAALKRGERVIATAREVSSTETDLHGPGR
jgi:hypothetical protein